MANDLITGYAHHTWQKGEVLTADGLNNIENGLWGIIARFKGESTDSSTFNPSQQIAIINDITEAIEKLDVVNPDDGPDPLKTISSLTQSDGKIHVIYQDIQKANGANPGVVAAGTNLSANNGELTIIDNPIFSGTLTVGNLSTTGTITAGTSTLTSLNIGTNDNSHYTIGTFTNSEINFYKDLSIVGSLELTGNSNTFAAGASVLDSLNIGTNNNTHYTIGSFTDSGINFYKNLNVDGEAILSSLNIGTAVNTVPTQPEEEPVFDHYSIASFNSTAGINFYKNLTVNGISNLQETHVGALTIGLPILNQSGGVDHYGIAEIGLGSNIPIKFYTGLDINGNLNLGSIQDNHFTIGSFTNNNITLYQPTIIDEDLTAGNTILSSLVIGEAPTQQRDHYSIASFSTNSTNIYTSMNILDNDDSIATFNSEAIEINKPLYIQYLNDDTPPSNETAIIISREGISFYDPQNNNSEAITLNYSTLSDLLALLSPEQPSGGD